MKKTSLKQKLLLILFGVFLALVLLEAGLRLAGALVLYLQERHNHFSFGKNEYRILCLGESTTALGGEDSYPSQLEELLNAQHKQQLQFTVINEGIISTTTDYILAHLDGNLDTYKPQMVVLMMGINDKFYLHDHKDLWWENVKLSIEDLRVYKVARLLYERFRHLNSNLNPTVNAEGLSSGRGGRQQTEDFLKVMLTACMQSFHGHAMSALQYRQRGQEPQAQEEDRLAKQSVEEAILICLQLAQRYRVQGSFTQAQDFLEQAALFGPNNALVYEGWGEIYLAEGKSSQSVKAFQTSLALDPKNNYVLLGLARAYHQEHNDNAFLFYNAYLHAKPEYWGCIELAKWLSEDDHDELAEIYLNQAITLDPNLDRAYVELGQILDTEGQYKQEEGLYLKEIPLHPKSAPLYQALGRLYEKQGRDSLAGDYFKKGKQWDTTGYLPVTLVNYSLILDKILNRHIKVVVMQYPLRDITPLKDYLSQRKGVTFVENRQNFRQALLAQGYWYYFKDTFGDDFGHCTRAGNELIARNLAATILTKILKPN